MLLQTFFLLLNVSFPPCFPSPLLSVCLSVCLSLSLSLLFFFRGGGAPGAPPPESAPDISINPLGTKVAVSTTNSASD